MTENLKGKMGHKMNHFNVGKGHLIEEVKIILHCINFNIPCHKALNACTLSTTFNFVKKYTFFHLVLYPHLPPTTRLLQFGSDLSSCPKESSRVRVIIRVRLENMGPGIPENDKHPCKVCQVVIYRQVANHATRIVRRATMAQESHSPVLVFDSPVMVLHSPVLIFIQSSFNFYTV